MFKKKKELPVIAYIHLSFNIDGIKEWAKSPKDIGIDDKWVSNSSKVTHSIDWFIKDDIYYHQSVNQHSHLITGSQFIDDELGSIEWQVMDNYLYVSLTYQRIIIGKFPLNEIRELIQKGEANRKDPVKDLKGYPVKIDDPDNHIKEVLKKAWFHYGLIYSNNLVSLDFSLPSNQHVTEYESL